MSKARTMSSLLTSSGDVITTALDNVGAAITAGSGIALGDNDKATFGAGDDLEVYHDGSNSYVKDAGTGSLQLLGSSYVVIGSASGAGEMISAQSGAEVNLKFNNSNKLVTKATGVTVTGEMATTTIAASGAVATGPLTTTGDINLSGELNLNAASNNYIDFTDALHIRAAGSSPAYEDSIHCIKDAAVSLMYNGSAKIATTNTGVSVTGDVVASGNVTAYSDLRIKDNLEVISDALSKVEQLNGYTYTRTDSEDKQEKHTGVIAQEVLKVLPEAVVLGETPEDNMAVAYGNMVGLLIEAVKELSDKVKELEENQNGSTK
jgi:hypothetical protein